MPDNVLDSYLVRLGATVDTSSFVRFNAVLKGSENTVTSFTSGALSQFLKFEFAAISTLTSVGIGLIGLADKTAMADQQYRLFGMRMLMTKDSARAMQMALGQLDATLDEVSYDKELNQRFQYLYEQNEKLGKTLGPNFDKNMIGIRGLRTEVKFFGDELEVLAMGSISKLFEKLGYSIGDLQNRLDRLSDEFMKDIPYWSEQISSNLIPVWNEFKLVLSESWDIAKSFIGDYTLLDALVRGDDSVQNAQLSWTNFGKSIKQSFNDVFEIVNESLTAIKAVDHAFKSAIYSGMAMRALAHGKTDEASKYLNMGDKESDKIIDFLYGQYNTKFTGGDYSWRNKTSSSDMPSTASAPDSLKPYLANPQFQALLYGVGMRESGGHQFDINGRPTQGPATDNFGNPLPERAVGKYQLFPSSAKKYGFDINTEEGNTLAAASLLRDLLIKHKNNDAAALADYGGFKKADPSRYIGAVKRFAGQYSPSSASISIGSVVINVPHSIPPHEMSRFVKDSMSNITDKAIKQTTAQMAAGAYY
jgi:hypothetical protein